MKTLAGFLKEVAVILKDSWNALEESGYCCGVRLDPRASAEHMPTASSCCGISA